LSDLVLVGGGGHAKVVADVLLSLGIRVAGFTSNHPEPASLLGIPRLGEDDTLPELHRKGVKSAFVAIGDNRLRLSKIAQLQAYGYTLPSLVSPRATVSPFAVVHAGVLVMPGATVNACAELMEGVIVNTNASVDHDCRVDRGAHLAPNTALAGKVRVGEGVLLGIGSSVAPEVEIGSWAVVGAGSVVIRSLEGGRTYAGAPARVLK
jgi:UDP-perosamine 4-acetyltransferase